MKTRVIRIYNGNKASTLTNCPLEEKHRQHRSIDLYDLYITIYITSSHFAYSTSIIEASAYKSVMVEMGADTMRRVAGAGCFIILWLGHSQSCK